MTARRNLAQALVEQLDRYYAMRRLTASAAVQAALDALIADTHLQLEKLTGRTSRVARSNVPQAVFK